MDKLKAELQAEPVVFEDKKITVKDSNQRFVITVLNCRDGRIHGTVATGGGRLDFKSSPVTR